MKHKRFRVGKQPTAITARKRAPRGSAFVYTLSPAATVRIDIFSRQPGRSAGGKCKKPTRRLIKRKPCTRLVLKGSLSRKVAAGKNSTAFSGRIGRRALKSGKYLARITAGNVKSARFAIVRR